MESEKNKAATKIQAIETGEGSDSVLVTIILKTTITCGIVVLVYYLVGM